MGYKIIVRMDDICPWMDIDRFNKYIEMLSNLGIKPLLGIVPDCRDKQLMISEVTGFWELMREYKKKSYPIAMHGVFHTYVSNKEGLVCKRPMSEFAGLSYKEQYEKLSHGLAVMREQDLETDVFFAPGHSYDCNTLKALKKLGFNYISDGRSFGPYILEGVKCIPAASAYRLHFGRGLLTICIHSNNKSEKDYMRLKEFLEKKKNKIISFNEAKAFSAKRYLLSRIGEKVNLTIDQIIMNAAGIIKNR